MKVGFISLGCNKNLVDTEKTIALFKKHDYKVVNMPDEADIIVINTCGFIQSAKEEAINTILEMAEYKKRKCKYLIVMGCLVERYKKELEKELPEVDLYIKYSEYNTIWQQIEKMIVKKQNVLNNCKIVNNKLNNELNDGNKVCINECLNKEASKENTNKTFDEMIDRVITTGENYAYLKIADGCSNCCTYCAIPKIRGKLKSRKMESIIEEAKKLAVEGYKELILTAQDTTKYGIDIYNKPMLLQLLKVY